MRLALVVVLALFALALGPPLWELVPTVVVAPQLPVLFAVYMGIAYRERLLGVVVGSVAVGYLTDVMYGAPVGLWATVAGVVCLASRLVSRRLHVRGLGFELVFVWAMSLVGSGALLLLKVSFGLPVWSVTSELWLALRVAVVTAVVAPLLFGVLRRIDIGFARTEREREALRQGYAR